MNAKNPKNTINMDDFSVHFDLDTDTPAHDPQPGLASQKKDQSLKVVNYLEIESKRLSHLSNFLDTPVETHKKHDLTKGLISQIDLDLEKTKHQVITKLSQNASGLFQNIEYLWEKTFL